MFLLLILFWGKNYIAILHKLSGLVVCWLAYIYRYTYIVHVTYKYVHMRITCIYVIQLTPLGAFHWPIT